MTVRDVLKRRRNSRRSDRRIRYPLPREYDDFEKLTDFLSPDHVFDTLAVSASFGLLRTGKKKRKGRN